MARRQGGWNPHLLSAASTSEGTALPPAASSTTQPRTKGNGVFSLSGERIPRAQQLFKEVVPVGPLLPPQPSCLCLSSNFHPFP